MEKSSKLLLGLLLSTAVLAGTGVALIIDIFFNAPDFTVLKTQVTYPIEMANKEWTKRTTGPQSGNWVTFKNISNNVIMAVIASEDASFFSHQGVDFHELKEAIKKDWEEKRWARGGSTITQQVVKNAFLGRQKTLWRKLKEFFWAQQIEKVLTKSEILAFYLNMVEWGPNIYGIKDAAKHYFGVTPSELTAKQGAFLAMLLPSPKKYHANFAKKTLTPWAQSRVDQILRVMNRMSFIDDGSYEVALSEPLWGVTGISKKHLGDSFESIPSEDPSVELDKWAPEPGTRKESPVETEPTQDETLKPVIPESAPAQTEEVLPREDVNSAVPEELTIEP